MPPHPEVGALTANGQYSYVAVNLIAAPSTGTITASYIGTYGSFSQLSGVYTQTSSFPRVIAYAAAAATTKTYYIAPPFGTTSGRIYFQFESGTPPSGTHLVVSTGTALSGTYNQVFPAGAAYYSVLSTANLQAFDIAAVAGDSIQIQYTGSGGSSALYDMTYFFLVPGAPPPVPLCQSVTTVSISGNTSDFAVSAGVTAGVPSVRVCSVSITSAAGGTFQLVQGTLLSTDICGTGNAPLSGLYTLPANGQIVLSFPGLGLDANPGQNVCITTTSSGGGAVYTGTVTYSQF